MNKININSQQYQNSFEFLKFEIDDWFKENVKKILEEKGSNRAYNKLVLLSNILDSYIDWKLLFQAIQSINDSWINKITCDTINNLFISILDRNGK